MNVNRRGSLACLLAAVLLLGACGSPDGAADEDGRLSVVASTDVWADVARIVGGDRVAVEAIIDRASADPHSYRATARDAADVLDADLVVYNGGGYDPFMTELLRQGEVSAVNAFRVSGHGKGREHGHAGAHAESGEHGHEHPAVNEHVFYDPQAVARVADALAGQLARQRPAAKQTFLDNAAAFKARLDELSGRIDRIATAHSGTRVLATSPMSYYLLEQAELRDIAPGEFTEAVEEGSDIPILAQQHVKKLITSETAEVIIQNAQTVTPAVGKLIELAQRQGMPVVEVTETLPEGKDYISWMTAQVQALAGALNKR